MFRILVVSLLSVVFLQAAQNKNSLWDFQHTYRLKKDEIANITIATAASKGEDKTNFIFRWTLVVGDRVTLHINHRGYPHQYVLYDKRLLNKLKLPIMNDGSNRLEDKSYLLMVLSDIGQRKDEVEFDIFIKDKKNRLLVDFGIPEAQKEAK